MPTEAGSIMTHASQTVEAVLETQPAGQATQPPTAPTFTVEPTSPSEPPSNAQLGDTWTRPADGMLLHFIPAGEFLMGSTDSDPDASSDEKPQHTVTLDAYWIDQTEVTNAMFERYVQETGYQTTAEKAGSGYIFNTSTKSWEDTQGADWRHPRGLSSSLDGLENHPVVQGSWDDAVAYCSWAGGRLPSEAEWEKAARGVDGRIFPWGNQTVAGGLLNFADLNLDVDWADRSIDDGYQFTAPVGSYPAGASPYGLFDMAGNVWEWVQDWYSETYYASSPASNPTGLSSGDYRALRGGPWVGGSMVVRTAVRGWYNPDYRSVSGGFRCVR
jgi:formylglycine-generating enzyme required for sulfatase activity